MSIAAALEQNLRARVARNLPAVSDQMVEETRQACSRRTGALADSIMADPWQEQGDRYVTTISAGRGLPNPAVAAYQDRGTGIYGPNASRIYPRKPGGVLAFDWPAAGGVVFARSVAGSPGTFFFSGEDGQAMRQRFESALGSTWAA